jgi:hypothetical protein
MPEYGPPARDPEEIPLAGGVDNLGSVVRVGDTVRRPQRPTSAATHALLRHLESVGFEGAPRLLGVDEQGREVLSYIEGSAVLPPYPDWALTTRRWSAWPSCCATTTGRRRPSIPRRGAGRSGSPRPSSPPPRVGW